MSKNENVASTFTWWTNYRVQGIVLAVLAVLLYANTFSHEYAMDDRIVITDNKFTAKGAKGIPDLLTEDTFFGFFKRKTNLVAGGRYRPLSLVTFALENEVFGTSPRDAQGRAVVDEDGDVIKEAGPEVRHIINALLYGLLAWIMFAALLELVHPNREKSSLKGQWIPWVATLLFVVHPIHTEAVANIKGRDEIMVMLFGLAALWTVLVAYRKPHQRTPYLIASAGLLLLSMLSKESGIAFVALIPIALLLFRKPKRKLWIQCALPLVASAAIWFGLRGMALSDVTAASGPNMELMNNPFLKIQNDKYVAMAPTERYGIIFLTWGKYIELLAVPHTLTNDYYPWHLNDPKQPVSLSHPRALWGLAIHLVLLGLILYFLVQYQKHRKGQLYLWGLLFFYATFILVSNLLFPIGAYMAERFMFMPSLGYTFILAAATYALARRLTPEGQALKRTVPLVLVLAISALYAGKTIQRNSYWKNDYTLFTEDVKVSANSAKINNALAGILMEPAYLPTAQAQPQVRQQQLQRALQHANKSIELHPNYYNPWLLRGNALLYLQAYDEAIQAYQHAIQLSPEKNDAPRNIGIAYREKGKQLGEKQGNLQGALQHLQQALQYNTQDIETYRLLGVTYGMLGQHQQSLTQLEQALTLDPQNVPVLYTASIAAKFAGQAAKAQQYEQRWRQINPNYQPGQ